MLVLLNNGIDLLLFILKIDVLWDDVLGGLSLLKAINVIVIIKRLLLSWVWIDLISIFNVS